MNKTILALLTIFTSFQAVAFEVEVVDEITVKFEENPEVFDVVLENITFEDETTAEQASFGYKTGFLVAHMTNYNRKSDLVTDDETRMEDVTRVLSLLIGSRCANFSERAKSILASSNPKLYFDNLITRTGEGFLSEDKTSYSFTCRYFGTLKPKTNN